MNLLKTPFLGPLLGTLLLMTTPTSTRAADDHPEEAAIRASLKSYFDTGDIKKHQALVTAINQDPAWRPDRINELLHGLPLWPHLKPGRFEIDVKVGFGHVRKITFRIPKGYTPNRKWPLLLCYHSSGSNGPSILAHTERLLGAEVDNYILAAPTNYRQTSLDAPPPYTQDHPAMLRAIRKTVHVDSDRVLAIGYSLGGYMSWTMAIFHPDLLAAAIPMASTISIPGDLAGGWEQITRNFSQLPILHVWGSSDSLNVPGFEARDQFAGSMSSFNETFSPYIRKLGLKTITENRISGAGHGGATPNPDDLRKILKSVRVRWPEKVQHQYRHLHQGSAYWLEANEWAGAGWFESGRRVDRLKGETWPQAYGRAFLPLLGELQGEVVGQKIRINTQHVADFTVWLSPELINFDQPIEIELAGKKVFGAKVKPDLAVLLDRAERTRDFERLPWAGIRINAAGDAKILDAATVLPPLIRKP